MKAKEEILDSLTHHNMDFERALLEVLIDIRDTLFIMMKIEGEAE